nr:hypothetical protein [uncultured Rhodopila sp.]
MGQQPIGLLTRDLPKPYGIGVRLTPAWLRSMLIAAVAASALLAWFVTRGDPANPDAELVRVLQFMTVAKGLIGFGVLWLVSIRFRYLVAPRLAFGYIAGSAIMASGPGAMWTTAHIVLGSLLFYAGIGVLLTLGWADGRALSRFARRT